MEKARPHPNLLPREKESGRAARCMIGSVLAHNGRGRANNTMADERAPSPGGEGRGALPLK